MRLHLLLLVTASSLCFSTEGCMRCRQLEYLNGPGIGIDLTMGYGTAAVKFKNGSIYDIIKIGGSPEYLSAMRTLAADALDTRAGIPSKWRIYAYHPPPEHGWFLELRLLPTPTMLFASLLRNIWRAVLHLLPWKIQSTDSQVTDPAKSDGSTTDPWIIAIAGMLTELRVAVHSVYPAVSHNLVILSWPDFEMDTNHIYTSSFQIACQLAGLEEFSGHSQIASGSVLSYYNIATCYDDEFEHSPYCNDSSAQKIDVALVVTYGQSSFGTTLMTRWYGTLFPLRVAENFNHGANALLRREDPDIYWGEMKALIQEAVQKDRVDYLILLGSDTDNEDLLRVIQEVFEAGGYRTTWEKYLALSKTGDQRKEMFAAARGASRIARNGMQNGFDACLVPGRCPKGDGEDDDVDVDDYGGILKTEL